MNHDPVYGDPQKGDPLVLNDWERPLTDGKPLVSTSYKDVRREMVRNF